MRARYRRTVAGFFWVVAHPIIIYGVQSFIFKNVLRIQVPDYTLFLIGGLLPWTFVAGSLETGIPVLQSSRDLLTGFKIEPFLLVGSCLLDNWVNFMFALILVILPSSLFYPIDTRGLLLLPISLIPLLIGISGLLWFLSVLNVFYRDTRFLTAFGVHILFYLTPLFYPVSFLPRNLRWLAEVNPVYFLIHPIRASIYSFSPGEFAFSWIRALLASIAISGLAFFYWKRRRNEFYHFL